MKVSCPRCDHEFYVEEWVDFNCPQCNNFATWDSEYSYDDDGYIEDEWPIIDWQFLKEE